jgi:ribosomal RNA-processing protein 7
MQCLSFNLGFSEAFPRRRWAPIALHLSSAQMSGAFSGFTPLALAYTAEVTHYLYLRAHTGKKSKSNRPAPPAPQASSSSLEPTSSVIELPAGRTLFVVNVPPDATERDLTLLFKPAGTIEQVIFPDEDEVDDDPLAGLSSDVDSDSDMEEEQDVTENIRGAEVRLKKRRKKDDAPRSRPPEAVPLPSTDLRTIRKSGRSVHVIFLDESSLKRALSSPFCPPYSSSSKSPTKSHAWPPRDTAPPPRGLAHYIAQYSAARPPLEIVRTHADAFMARFDHAKAQERRQMKYRKGEAVVDEDGFTLVTRGGAYGQTVGGGVGVASKKFQTTAAKSGVSALQGSGAEGRRGKGRKKREGKEKDNFYKFQIHEERRNSKWKLLPGMCHH